MDSGCRVCGNKLVGGQLSGAVGGPRAFGHLSRQRATAADNVRPSSFMFVHHAAKKRCRRGQGGRGEGRKSFASGVGRERFQNVVNIADVFYSPLAAQLVMLTKDCRQRQ